MTQDVGNLTRKTLLDEHMSSRRAGEGQRAHIAVEAGRPEERCEKADRPPTCLQSENRPYASA